VTGIIRQATHSDIDAEPAHKLIPARPRIGRHRSLDETLRPTVADFELVSTCGGIGDEQTN
jgi:hypothetical protein